MRNLVCIAAALLAGLAGTPSCLAQSGPAAVGHLQGEMAGEVTKNSVLLQSRLTAPELDDKGNVPGARGVARFEVAEDEDFGDPVRTAWLTARPDRDYIIRTVVDGLRPNTRYYYRLVFGPDTESLQRGPARTFRTLPGRDNDVSTRFVVTACMNYAFFQEGKGRDPSLAYNGPDKHLGYPALAVIRDMQPDFFVGTGDNVYYDHHKETSATTASAMRAKWHEQFVLPRMIDLMAEVPAYWEKDDHDYRYNDADTTGSRPPSHDLGIEIFREQMPVTDPEDPGAVTYRTHRVSKSLQMWLLEGRDYRSPNNMLDGPAKSIWGEEQRAWLKRTLAASDAPFKVVISPTPLIGPDDAYKTDNHTNPGGFRHERDAFFAWAAENGMVDKGLYFITGDRHWQYHSIHPTGFEEFSVGALDDTNSRLGVEPGDEDGTDPDGLIRQPFISPEASGGFLAVDVEPAAGGQPPQITFSFYDENGELLYQESKRARTL